jgi:hypothetical protein
MKLIFRNLSLCLLFFLLSACETTPSKLSMSEVMKGCELEFGTNFNRYSGCIKFRYQEYGTQPNAITVRAFLAQVEVLEERYSSNQISNAQAKALTHDYYLKTIHAQNQRDTAAADAALLNTLNSIQQQQNQQQIIQQLRAPVQTNCIRNGQTVNCTSF